MAGEQVIERPISEAQSVYDSLCEKRRSLNGHAKLRHDALENIPKYKQLSKDMSAKRVERQSVVADFDEENPSHKNRMESVKDDIDALTAKLTGIALEHFKKTGTMLEVKKKMRSGGEKKVRVGFSAQMSLF